MSRTLPARTYRGESATLAPGPLSVRLARGTARPRKKLRRIFPMFFPYVFSLCYLVRFSQYPLSGDQFPVGNYWVRGRLCFVVEWSHNGVSHSLSRLVWPCVHELWLLLLACWLPFRGVGNSLWVGDKHFCAIRTFLRFSGDGQSQDETQ